MLLKAHGKINLSLDITGLREDGYHDIASVMQSVELADEVEITQNTTRKIVVRTDSADLSDGEDNIAYKACAQMISDCGLSCGFDIVIKKNIPIAGGMAGGSADAAAVIRGIDRLCALNLPLDRLMEIGLKIGADVPFCIQENPALATGVGEVLTPVTGLDKNIWIVIVNPVSQVSTKHIYAKLDKSAEYGTVNNIALITALASGNTELATHYMTNIMEPVTSDLCKQVPQIISGLKRLGAIHAMMSGSGATCFGLFLEKPDMQSIKMRFPDYYFVALTKPFTKDS